MTKETRAEADERQRRSTDGSEVTALYAREAPRLARLMRRNTSRSEDAADLVQDVFVRFVGTAGGAMIGKPAAYLRRIAGNLIVDRARTRQRRGAFDRPLPLDEADVSTPPEQGYSMEAEQLMAAYRRALDALPPRTKQVFILHRVDQLSYGEIAERLGIGIRTVEWHITEALVRLRRMLDTR